MTLKVENKVWTITMTEDEALQDFVTRVAGICAIARLPLPSPIIALMLVQDKAYNGPTQRLIERLAERNPVLAATINEVRRLDTAYVLDRMQSL